MSRDNGVWTLPRDMVTGPAGTGLGSHTSQNNYKSKLELPELMFTNHKDL